MLTGITAMQGSAMAVSNAILFRAWDLHGPPPLMIKVFELAQRR
jgi:hypothetical protein